MGLKHILMSEEEPPPEGLESSVKIVGRLNPAVVPHNKKELSVFPRVVFEARDGKQYSCITKVDARIEGEEVKIIGREKVVLVPDINYSYRGVEDLRIVILAEEPGFYHVLAVAFSGILARTEYRRTRDLEKPFERFGQGILFPNIDADIAIKEVNSNPYKERWGEAKKAAEKNLTRILNEQGIRREGYDYTIYLEAKDCCILPRKIEKNGEKYYGVIIRLMPNIQLALIRSFEDLAKREFWEDFVKNIEKRTLLTRKYDWEESHIGLGGPLLDLGDGTALIFTHGVVMKPERVYKGGLALVDLQGDFEKPFERIIARAEEPILIPDQEWEWNGGVKGGVVFPTGHAVMEDGETIYLFYGAADNKIVYKIFKKSELLSKLKPV